MDAASEFPEDVDELSTADLEDAYLKALEAMESAEWAVTADADRDLDDECDSTDAPLPRDSGDVEVAPSGNTEIAGADFLGSHSAATPPSVVDPQDDSPDSTNSPNSEAKAAHQHAASSDSAIKPLRVIEACLFVGGQPLSAKKLANLLDAHNEASDIETLIDELNQEYSAQHRPYEIRLGDGGYKLTLRAEFESIRSRVFGVGPRDVKLSQDVLEVLALVAYQQPITAAAVEACKPNSANLLRQLLRRELICLNRIDNSRNGVEYSTTPRFLQLFGLGHLNELPRPEDLSIR